MPNHEVRFEVRQPPRHARLQVALRVAIALLLALFHATAAWWLAVLYLLLPIVAAISIQHLGARGYAERAGKALLQGLHGWNAFVAYMLFVTDRFPAEPEDLALVSFEVEPSGRVDAAHALLRLVMSLPEFLVVLISGWAAALCSVVAAISVLLVERVPPGLWRFLSSYVAFQARWLVYHASLVERRALTGPNRWRAS